MIYKIIPFPYRAKDLTGKTFGRLVAVGPVGNYEKNRELIWFCICKCATECFIPSGKLNSGSTKSCGCLRKSTLVASRTTHGMTGTPEYNSWRALNSRCKKETHEKYKYYGGRGIEVKYRGFEEFFADVGPRKNQNQSIDRINNGGHYEPGNCKWSTQKEQARNTRNNVNITYKGSTHCISEWAEVVGIKAGTLHWRIRRGWSIERSFTTPIQLRKKSGLEC